MMTIDSQVRLIIHSLNFCEIIDTLKIVYFMCSLDFTLFMKFTRRFQTL